jgi:hypothetical protein
VHRLNVLVQNVNGISLRDEEVIATAMKLKADFVLVTETLLHSQRALFRGDSKSTAGSLASTVPRRHPASGEVWR